MRENRYINLKKAHPKHAQELFAKNKSDAQFRYRQLTRMVASDWSNEIVEEEVN